VTPIGYVGIPVALLGAFLLSFGSAVQQRGVSEVDARTDGKGGLAVRQMLALVANRHWLWGTVLVILAIVCQLTALGLSPIAVVQPIGVFALVITAIISARSSHRELGSPTRRAIAICVGAVVVFVTIAALTTHVAAIHNRNVIVALILVGAVVAIVGITFLMRRKTLTRIFYVISSGVLFGFVATLAKVIIGRVETVVQAHESPFAVGGLTYVCLLGIIVAGSLGQYLQQSAFTSGSPEVVVAGLTVIDPIVGASVGLAALGEAARTPGWAFIVFVVAGLVAVYGVVRLSRVRPLESSTTDSLEPSPQQ
jgi:drug/metabolite transporter (DMT)-like permease